MDRLLETAEQGLEKNELDNLKKVFDLGFINDEEYKRRRQEILLRAGIKKKKKKIVQQKY